MCHVLIIEDEPLVALQLRDVLEDEGATSFDFAVSEAEAIAAALKHRPALITSDVRLVEGTGPHAITAIHELIGSVPVIFITGTPQECTPCQPPGVVLSKPFKVAEVARAFHELAPAQS